jgi:GT2 family glycosyltransferase
MAELVSIVIVAYQNWPDLELAIQSALCQSYRPVEVIVVDNSSTDATPQEVPRRFGDRLRYLRQDNRGDSGGYNAGMAVARGDFVLFLDGDDLLAPNIVEKEMETFARDPSVDVVYGQLRQFQTLAGPARWEDWDHQEHDDILLALAVHETAGLMAQCTLFRRRALESVGPFDESLYVADYDYFLRAAWAGCRFRFCPEALAFYRNRPGQMSADTPALMRGMAAVWTKALTYVDREPYRSEIAARLAQRRFALASGGSRAGGPALVRELAAARALNPSAVPVPLFAAAAALAVLPGGRFFLASPVLASARRLIARLYHFY